MPNFTRPDLADTDYEDQPINWLAGSIIFARALGELLKENEGVVVEVKGEATKVVDFKKVIVYNSIDQIRVIECDQELEEGTKIIVHPNES